jgi:hypothetical protein
MSTKASSYATSISTISLVLLTFAYLASDLIGAEVGRIKHVFAARQILGTVDVSKSLAGLAVERNVWDECDENNDPWAGDPDLAEEFQYQPSCLEVWQNDFGPFCGSLSGDCAPLCRALSGEDLAAAFNAESEVRTGARLRFCAVLDEGSLSVRRQTRSAPTLAPPALQVDASFMRDDKYLSTSFGMKDGDFFLLGAACQACSEQSSGSSDSDSESDVTTFPEEAQVDQKAVVALTKLASQLDYDVKVPDSAPMTEHELRRIMTQLQVKLSAMSAKIPVVDREVPTRYALQILTVLTFGLVVVMRNRLRYVFGDPELGAGDPWLLVDPSVGVEKYLANAWLLFLLLVPWIVGSTAIAAETGHVWMDQIAPSTYCDRGISPNVPTGQDFEYIAFFVLILGLTWLSARISIEIVAAVLQLRYRRRLLELRQKQEPMPKEKRHVRR